MLVANDTKAEMTRRFLFIVVLFFGASIGKICAQQPNVLFIAIDDLNTCPEDLDGETSISTPNMSELFERGVLFMNAHCAAPACNPSRTAVMTGLAPYTTGVYVNNQDWRQNSLLKEHITLPEAFRNAGYKTMGGGKLYHSATLSKAGYTGYMDPEPWDEYFPSKERQMPQEVLPDSIPMHSSKKFYGGRFDWAALDIEAAEMADAKVVSWAEEQLSENHEQPLFLAVGIYRPHIPWYTPEEYYTKHPLGSIDLPEILENDLDDVPVAGKSKLKNNWHQWILDHDQWKSFVRAYYASVSFTDDMIGRLIDALDKGPLAENTIIVLWSDHGYHLGQKQHWEKFALWEQTTRIPMFIAEPGIKTMGRKCFEATSLLDLYPTLIELCSLEQKRNLDGISLVKNLDHPAKSTRRIVITTHGKDNHALRSKRWRYIRYADGSEELYDQRHDPKNFYNLATEEKYSIQKKRMAANLPAANAPKNPEKPSPLSDKRN